MKSLKHNSNYTFPQIYANRQILSRGGWGIFHLALSRHANQYHNFANFVLVNSHIFTVLQLKFTHLTFPPNSVGWSHLPSLLLCLWLRTYLDCAEERSWPTGWRTVHCWRNNFTKSELHKKRQTGLYFSKSAPVVQTLDSAIHKINQYPVDKY